MILVNFKGYGEWFIRDGNSLKLAIVRTTKNPFEDPLEWKPPKPYGPYSDEYPYPDDDNEESFYERQQSFPDRDREFDRDLRGIFARDPDVRGKIYDTNGLRCFGADYMICGKHPEFGLYPFRGVFRLTEEDEEDFHLANFDTKTDWDKFKDRIKILKPSSHPSSLFAKMVNEGKLSVDIEDKVYFEIQKKLYLDFYGAPSLEDVPYILDYVEIETHDSQVVNKINNTTPKNPNRNSTTSQHEKRIESISKLVIWLKDEAKKDNNEFDPFNLNLTKQELLEVLKAWEKKRNYRYEWTWNKLKNLDSCKKTWAYIRENICDVRGEGAPSKEAKNKDFYKKIILNIGQ